MPTLRRLLPLCALAYLTLAAAPVAAATITVTSTADSGPGSLRQALASANAGDTIQFALPAPATIVLTSGELDIRRDVTLAGPGVSQLTINRDANSGLYFRMFTIEAGVTATISGMTISGGNNIVPGQYTEGGSGILNNGMLTLSNVLLTHNITAFGVLQTAASGSLVLVDSALVDNDVLEAYGYGAPVLWGGSMTIRRSTIANHVGGTPATGIGVYAQYGTSTAVSIENSTIDGTIWALSGNATVTVNASTIVSTDDADLFGSFPAGTFQVSARNSILIAAPGRATIAWNVTSTSRGFNLFSDAGGGFPDVSDGTSMDPMLGPLQDNGGPTPTHLLLPGSPAIDAGVCTDSNGETTSLDQRGSARPRGRGCDIGALEVAPNHELQVDLIAQTVASTLDTAVSTRATQASVDALNLRTGEMQQRLNLISSIEVDTTTGINAVKAAAVEIKAELDAVSASLASLGTVGQLGSDIANLNAGVSAKASQTSVDALAREAIERALANGDRIALYMRPAIAGGQLELVRQFVDDTLAGMQQIGIASAKASKSFARGDAEYAAGKYPDAYDDYASAYQQVIKSDDKR